MLSVDFLVNEFLFDCQIRSLSELTIANYKKQLTHFTQFLETSFNVTDFSELKPIHVKQYIKYYQARQCKPFLYQR